jgi:hypothetical protein
MLNTHSFVYKIEIFPTYMLVAYSCCKHIAPTTRTRGRVTIAALKEVVANSLLAALKEIVGVAHHTYYDLHVVRVVCSRHNDKISLV